VHHAIDVSGHERMRQYDYLGASALGHVRTRVLGYDGIIVLCDAGAQAIMALM